MWQPRITLNGMFRYDPTLFEGVVLPDGMDTEVMIAQIIRQSGDLFPLYQVPAEVKKSITQWFTRRLPNFEKLWQGFTAEYNPIENYDRREESMETPNITRVNTTGGTKIETPNITRTVSNKGSDQSTNTANVSGFDSTGYVPNSETTASGKSETSGDERETGTRTYTDDTTIRATESGTRKTESRIHGNIGVTTSAQMLSGELSLRASLDLYVIIATEFEADILLQIY